MKERWWLPDCTESAGRNVKKFVVGRGLTTFSSCLHSLWRSCSGQRFSTLGEHADAEINVEPVVLHNISVLLSVHLNCSESNHPYLAFFLFCCLTTWSLNGSFSWFCLRDLHNILQFGKVKSRDIFSKYFPKNKKWKSCVFKYFCFVARN